MLASTSRSFCSCAPAHTSKVPRSARRTPVNMEPPRIKHPKPLAPSVPKTELFTALTSTPAIRNRPTLINEDSARDLVRAWGVDQMHDVTVVEPYAGPGGLTRAFLELKNVKRVIAIEDAFRYMPHLASLKAKLDDPDRLHHMPMDSFHWETYTQVKAQGSMRDVPEVPWEQVHPNLFLAAQVPNHRHGEQLFVQFVSAAAGRMWYYQYGRFQMGFLGSESFWKKIFAKPGEVAHHKLAVLLPALAKLERVEIMSGLRPADMHFHRPRGDPAIISGVKATPHVTPLVKNYDALEYIARHMFVGKATSWSKALAAISPGTGNLVPKLVEQGLTDPGKLVNELTLEEWAKIADTFDAWPFRPANLFDEVFTEESARQN
ncbi:hypothetical protein JCM1841_006918 [Sporobolomyces salmonicolor]